MAVALSSSRSLDRACGSRGFSLVEMLVASMLLLVVVLGVIPLFVRSIISNSGGNDYTRLSNFSKSKVEELFQLDFSNAQLTIPAGQTETSIDEYWSEAEKKWKPGAAPAGVTPPWTRTTVIRQYNISAVDQTLDNFDFEKSEAVDGNTAAEAVHLKELIVTVQGMRGGPLGPRRDLVLRTLKAK
jgi:prepilin-type N-terminal cleavage/methylation domain-containing protein